MKIVVTARKCVNVCVKVCEHVCTCVCVSLLLFTQTSMSMLCINMCFKEQFIERSLYM